ncbi:death domain-containing protein 1-like [Asterias rubens]|uniref:death domain-containing protein 1-like n=1 Tax=Asterias rubens TaxID=7604 RepID=UPI001454FF50|nr:death domain-containing protein 1-like [Asterias rubens]
MADVPEAKPARCRHSNDGEQDEKTTRKAEQGKVASRKAPKASSQIASRSHGGSEASAQHSHGRRLSGSIDQGGSVSSEVPSSRGSVRSEVSSDKHRGSGRNSLASADTDSITSDVSAGKRSSVSGRYGSSEVQDGAYSTDEDLSKSASTLHGVRDGRSMGSMNSIGNEPQSDASDRHSEDNRRDDEYEVRNRASSRQTSSSAYSKELEYGDEGTPSDLTAVFSSFITVIHEETERLQRAESLGSIETSHVRGVLGELSETLRESEDQSLRLFEGIEAIREAAQGLKKTLEARLNRSNDAEAEAMVDEKDNTDNKKAHSRAVAAVTAAKALLAEVALDVASATQMAAEAETAAAEAAAAAETAKEELAEIEDRLDQVEDAERPEEDAASEASGAVDDEQKEDKEDAEDRLEDGPEEELSLNWDSQEKEENEDARSLSSRAPLRQGEDSVEGDAQEDEHEEDEEEKEDEGEENNEDVTVGDGENNKEEDDKPEDTPKPPPSPKRKRSIKENVLDWPHQILNLPDDDVTDDEIGCVIRLKEEYFTTTVPEFRCVINNNLSTDAVADSEELVSHVVTVEQVFDDDSNVIVSELEVPIVVAIPYNVSARMLSTKEFVVKFRGGNEDAWKVVPMLVADSSFEEHKGPFAEVRTYNLGSFAVVTRLNKERQTITKKGGVVKSSSDSRMNVSYPPGVCSLMSVTLQVQPAEQAVGDLRARMRHCSDLIAASPIIHLSHSPGKPFDTPVTVTIPCPPNPLKVPAATTANSTAGKTPEKQAPLSPDGAVIIRGTKSSIFGGDPAEDTLHLMHRQSNWGYWNEVENANIKQVRKDLVSIELDKPMDKVLILRMTADGRYPAKSVAQTFEKALQIKYATILLHHREDDPQRVLVQCVPSRQLEGALRRLNQDGYEGPPEPSGDIAMTEGQEITMRFTGNIKIVGRDQITFTFHTQRRNVIEFSIDEINKFGNHSSEEYRGMAEFYGRPRITLADMEDPEEVLLREADAKAAEKDSKHSGSSMLTKSDKKKPDGDGMGGRDYQQSLKKIETDLICKLPVSIPKAEPEPPLPPSRYRATAIDVGGTVSNANLRWLSTELGNEWESLSAALGIKRSRLQSIKRNNPIKVDQQVLDMLVTWRSMLPRAYDKERKLCRALVKCGRYDLAEELKERDATATEFSNNNVNMLDVDDY